jgi:hypothetical protein
VSGAVVVLKAPERFAFDAEVLPAGDGPPLQLELQGRYRTRSELEAFSKAMEGRLDVDVLVDELVGWNVQLEDGTPVPCDATGIARFLDIYPRASRTINQAYFDAAKKLTAAVRVMCPGPPKVSEAHAELAASMGIDPKSIVMNEPERSAEIVVWPELDPVLRLYTASSSQRRSNGAVDFRVLPLVARALRFGPVTAEVLADVRLMDNALREEA